ADAATAARLIENGRARDAALHVGSIVEAVRHMQSQVRRMLGRLRPIGLAEFGLREAVENLVAFWRRRRPEIRYEVAISAECEDLTDIVGTAICRIVQEALSNAVRHAEPNHIAISIERDRDLERGRDEIRLSVVEEAASGKEALSAFRRDRPDLVILDLNLPDIGGIEIIARLKIIDSEARILVLSMHDDRIHVTRALQAGAAGYVSKTIPPEEL